MPIDFFDLVQVRIDDFAIREVGDGLRVRVAGADRLALHLVLRGTGCLQTDDGLIALSPGMMIVVPAGTASGIHGDGRQTVVVDASVVEGFQRYVGSGSETDLLVGYGSIKASPPGVLGLFDHLDHPLVYRSQGPVQALLCATILGEMSSPAIGTKAIMDTIVKHLFVLAARDRSNSGVPSCITARDPRLLRSIAAMTEKPDCRHTIGSLASLAGMSSSNFQLHFTKAYGITPIAYLRGARLQSAARMLRTSTLPIAAIASRTGFESRSHFSRSFRDEFGIDPSAFRVGAVEQDGPARRSQRRGPTDQ